MNLLSSPRRQAMTLVALYLAIFLILSLLLRNFFNTIVVTIISVMIVDAAAGFFRKYMKISLRKSIVIAMITYFLLIAIGLVFLIPATFSQFNSFYKFLVDLLDKRVWEQYLKDNPKLLENINSIVDFLKPKLTDLFNYFLEQIATFTPQAILVAFFSILGTIYVSLYLSDLEHHAPMLFPKSCRDQARLFLLDLGQNMRRFIAVIVINALLVGISFGVLFKIMNLKYGIVIAFWAFVTNLIPIVGVLFEYIPVFIFSLSLGLEGLLWITVFTVLIHVGVFVLFLNVMKGYTRINPVILIFSILITGEVFGPVGIFFGVPLAMFLIVYWRRFLQPEFEKE